MFMSYDIKILGSHSMVTMKWWCAWCNTNDLNAVTCKLLHLRINQLHIHNSKILVANSLEEYFMCIWLINKDKQKVITCNMFVLETSRVNKDVNEDLMLASICQCKVQVQAQSYQRSLSSISISQEWECICGTWSYHKHYLFAITRTTLVNNETNILSITLGVQHWCFLSFFKCCVLCERVCSCIRNI